MPTTSATIEFRINCPVCNAADLPPWSPTRADAKTAFRAHLDTHLDASLFQSRVIQGSEVTQ